MWFALVGTALASGAADCVGWADCPVALGLHPVWWDPGARYQRRLEEAMTGRGASPAFSPVLNQAEAHWRLVAATGRGLRLAPEAAAAWEEYALAGAFLAADAVVGETAARSEVVDTLRTAVDVLVDPSAELTIRRDGKVRLEHPTGGLAGRWVRRREAAADLDAPGRPPARRPVKINLSAGWTLREPDAPSTQPLLSWTAQLAVRNAGLTLWRVDVDLLNLRWDALARQRLIEDWSAGVALHSAPEGPEPARWTAGLYWTPRPRVVLSATHSRPLDGEGWRVEAALRVELGTFLPGRVDPSLAGLPSVPDSGPNTLRAWTGGGG